MDRFRHVHFFDEASAAVVSPGRARGGLDRPRLSASSSREFFDAETSQFLALVLRRGGLHLNAYRRSTLRRRLRVCLQSLQATTVQEARVRLEQHPQYFPAALSALLLGVTRFFRDASVFRDLEETVLPDWIANRRPRRIWSAGCANGAELYSVAMLLDRHQLLSGNWLLGTDCRADALQRARRGWFDSPWELDGLPSEFREAYLVPARQGWYVRDSLRKAIHWGQDNLLALSAEEAVWDLILCRNVAIYLEPPAARRLWLRLVSSLRPGGILITGKAERPPERQLIQRLAPSVFQKLSGGIP